MNEHSVGTWITSLLSSGAIAAALLGHLPAVAAGVAAVWYFVQIWESATVQRWRANRRIRKLARLKARVVLLEAQDRASTLPSSGLRDEGPDHYQS
jgi:hypothetical protein